MSLLDAATPSAADLSAMPAAHFVKDGLLKPECVVALRDSFAAQEHVDAPQTMRFSRTQPGDSYLTCLPVFAKMSGVSVITIERFTNAVGIGEMHTATVHVDCDLYSAEYDVATSITPCLVQERALLCDYCDLFFADRHRGERRAPQQCADRLGIAFEPWFACDAALRAFLCHEPTPASAAQS